jgi:hypothetical protein
MINIKKLWNKIIRNSCYELSSLEAPFYDEDLSKNITEDGKGFLKTLQNQI